MKNKYKINLLFCGGGDESHSCDEHEIDLIIERLISHFDEDIDEEHYQCSVENEEENSISIFPSGLLCLNSLKDFGEPKYYLCKTREEVLNILRKHGLVQYDYKDFVCDLPKLPDHEIFGHE